MMSNIFFAYPGVFPLITDTIEKAASTAKRRGCGVETWKEMDIPGKFIATEVLSKIDSCELLCADITNLNFNVVYEIGYAIAKGKRIFLSKNSASVETDPTIKDVGIFDTIGYFEYQNSDELASAICDIERGKIIPVSSKENIRAPIYLLETRARTDHQIRLVSRLKKAGYKYRTFDPNESPRLSAPSAIDGVSQSYGVIVPLLSVNIAGFAIHNIRASFVAGLASGLQKALLIIQTSTDPIPIDYRDLAKTCIHPNEIDEAVADFAADVNSLIQSENDTFKDEEETLLEQINLGASSAENEMRWLDAYYIKTDAYMRARRGEVNLIVGRKGSGKSAIFIRLRDELRQNKTNIVLDLQPDGYKLIKFKESVLKNLEGGTFQHTITVFWEYVLLLEVCHKILHQDRELHLRSNELYDPYRELSEIYKSDKYSGEGDFSGRMSSLMDAIINDYQEEFGNTAGVNLSTPQVTELIYRHDIHKLISKLTAYLKFKDELWVLFDNLDKGWPTTGLKESDLIIIRTLIDATRKLQREMTRVDVDAHFLIFLRSDIYQLLVQDTSDRGKEANAIVDWTDPDLLRQMLKLRIESSTEELEGSFETIWPRIFTSHINGEESSQYLIDRCLMRPRFLIDLVNQCKSFAINLGHKLVEKTDIEKGTESFSNDILSDIGYELRDVSFEHEDLMYKFVGAPSVMSRDDFRKILSEFTPDIFNRLVDLFLWYGFIGIRTVDNKDIYIYDINYNHKMLKALYAGESAKTIIINPAFWKGLMINEPH